MKTFKDNNGREWPICINVASIKRVRDLVKVDLLSITQGDEKLIGQLIADPVTLVDVVYVLCKPDADRQGITDEDFGAAMVGDAMEHAANALLEDFADFFPKSRREVLRSAMAKMKEIDAILMHNAMQTTQSMDVQAIAQEAMAEVTKARRVSGT